MSNTALALFVRGTNALIIFNAYFHINKLRIIINSFNIYLSIIFIFINNTPLSDIERIFHIIQKTSGEATRIIFNNHFKLFFGLPVLDHGTSSGLKTLQHVINGRLLAMTIYDVVTDHWDHILVFPCGL